jgi:hypothetical protein
MDAGKLLSTLLERLHVIIAEPDDLSNSSPEVPPNTPAPRSASVDQSGIFTGPPPHVCPLCGHAAPPFDARLSALLDMLALMEALLHDMKREVEELAS